MTDRWKTTPPGLDEAEYCWWQQFSGVEEKFCWVQTPEVQRIIRGDYVSRIARQIPPGASVLELGCGTGWLSLLIAERCSARVTGTDFSKEQIRRAKEDARARGLDDRVGFYQVTESDEHLTALGPFDVVLIHGVLHHLSVSEIRGLLQSACSDLCRPQARLYLLEPVRYPVLRRTRSQAIIDKLINRLILFPMQGERSGLRKCSKSEAEARKLIGQRDQGAQPRGPSPKEMPFGAGELEEILAPYARITGTRHVLGFSYHAAKNLLLLQLSYPWWGRIALRLYLPPIRLLERAMLARGIWSSRLPVFDLIEADLQYVESLQSEPVP